MNYNVKTCIYQHSHPKCLADRSKTNLKLKKVSQRQCFVQARRSMQQFVEGLSLQCRVATGVGNKTFSTFPYPFHCARLETDLNTAVIYPNNMEIFIFS